MLNLRRCGRRTQRTTVLLFFSSHPQPVNVIHTEGAAPVARPCEWRREGAAYLTPLFIRLSELADGKVFLRQENFRSQAQGDRRSSLYIKKDDKME